MNTRFAIAFAFLCISATLFAEPSQQEVVALMNKVQSRVAGGDVNALNDLSTLPGSWAAPAFLTIFQQNYNIYGETAQNRAVAEKCADLATTVPGSEEYFVKLLKKKDANSPNWVYAQQKTAVKLLLLVHNKASVRIFCSALDDPEMGGKVANALATMGLPDAPYASKDKSAISSADDIAKWKQWWESNKNNYADSASPVK